MKDLMNTLLERLHACTNLTQLAKDAGVDVRTLRRIRHGHTKDVKVATAQRILSVRARS